MKKSQFTEEQIAYALHKAARIQQLPLAENG
jgi:hypothetical protein